MAGITYTQTGYRWYDDTHVPGVTEVALADENAPYSGAPLNTNIRIRIKIKEE